MNTAEWYAWGFSFRSSHYAMAWVAFGALVLHVAVKLTIIRDAYRRPLEDGEQPGPGADPPRPGARRPRASAVGVLAVAGRRCPWLGRLSVFETHSGAGPQDLPVTKSAARRPGSPQLAFDPSYALEVVHGGTHPHAQPRPAAAAAAAHRDAADRLRRGLEPVGGVDRGAAARPARPRRGARRHDGPGPVPPAARALPHAPRSAATSPTTPRRWWRCSSTASRSASTTGTRAGSSLRTAPGCCRPSGSAGS